MKKRILIIEDNPDERLIQRTILESAGYEVLESDNAKDGVDLAAKERPDLILMDIRLPYKKKGIGAAKTLRKKEETRDIPIIFVSAYSIWEHAKEVDNIADCGYLNKSYDRHTLLKYIERFLD
ncbi:response regulator [Omnitrophica bacterium]|nr:response regulator [Candidatus Omnitrophota bacterium]